MEESKEYTVEYTVVTFSPVQEFIEKTRKLRDLYGSSFLLSYLAYFTANAAKAINQNVEVIAPGILPDTVSGTSDYIVIKGKFSTAEAEELKQAFNYIWGSTEIHVKSCHILLKRLIYKGFKIRISHRLFMSDKSY